MNALAMEFEDDTFDLVWACESGEHMPDKAKYVQEMTRVLKPGEPIALPAAPIVLPSGINLFSSSSTAIEVLCMSLLLRCICCPA